MIKNLTFLLLLPFLGGFSLKPYSEYKRMGNSDKYEDLKLRFLIGDYSNFGKVDSEKIKNLRAEINRLSDLSENNKKLMDIFLISLLIKENKADIANKKLERFSGEESPNLRSQYYYLKGKIAFNKNQIDKSIKFYRQALDHAEGIEKYLITYDISHAEIKKGNNEKVLDYIEQGLKVVEGYKPGKASLLSILGVAYYQMGSMALALDNFFKALDVFKEMGDNNSIVETLLNVATTKYSLEKHDDEILYLKKAESYFSDDVSPDLRALVLGNISTSYSHKKDYKNAEIYYKKAIKVAETSSLSNYLIYFKSSFAGEIIKIDKAQQAINILNSLKTIPDDNWETIDKYRFHIFNSRAYLKLNKLKQAEDFFSKSEFFLDQIGREDVKITHYFDGVKLYKTIGDVSKEYSYYKKWRELKEKVENEKSKKLLYARENESLALNNQLYAQENKNLALKNEQAKLVLENQKTRLFMLSGFVIATLIIVALQFNRNKIIKRKNQDLEHKEKVIREKTNDLQAILDNIVQGVITIDLIDEGTRRIKDVSQHFYLIFTNINPESFKQNDPIKVIFKETSLTAEDLAKINSVIVSSTGESIWQWEINKSNLPMEMTILDNSKIIEIDWVVVLDQDTISKLIITFKDVTEIRGLGEKQKQNEISVQKLISLSLMDQKEYFILMSSVEKLIKESLDTIGKNKTFSKENIDLVFRNLHTVKGLARTYDLMLLSAFAHQIEDYFQDVRSKSVDYAQDECLVKLEEMRNEVETYRILAKTKLKWDQELSTVPLSVKVLTKWYKEISGINEGHKLDILLKEIKNKYSTSLEDALQNIIMSSQKLSKELNKGEVIFTLTGCDIFVTEKMQGHLSSIFVHLIRNSIDHGFLEISEREKQGLAPPEIKISVEIGDDHHMIFLSDNGNGIHLENLRRKAAENNIEIDTRSDIEVARLIFESGISTKESVSDISGRGVGMDAVRKYLKDLGGDIEILATGSPSDGYLPVQFAISIPEVFFDV